MGLSERKKKILQAIINDYINTADPIGSRTIAKKYDLGLSSATIRNEMADLEDMGYLEQPHTSAGRIPSNRGYRFYVDQLMKKYKLTVSEIRDIRKAMKLKIEEIDKLINSCSQIVSKLTNYTAVVMSPQINKNTIKRLQLVPIDKYNMLLVIVTDSNVVKNKKIKSSELIDINSLNKLTNILNVKLKGLTIKEISDIDIQDINEEINIGTKIILSVMSAISEGIKEIDEADVFLGGTTNLLNFPEYNDIEKAREFINFLEQKKEIKNILIGLEDEDDMNVVIGDENKVIQMQDCSLIVSKYSVGDRVVGKIGIIGPTRMKYAKVISSLDYITKNLSYILMEYFYDDDYE